MARYILKRLLWIIPVVLGVTIMVFTIMYLTPGDPARMILGSNATEEKVEELHEQLGMNGNYFQRLGRYMKQVFIDHDLGSSYYTGVRVTDQIKARLPFTLRIAGISILIAVSVFRSAYLRRRIITPGLTIWQCSARCSVCRCRDSGLH